ncbi:MAG: hypothetical protein L0Y60_14665 [Beijerinckiaceae bacterium]|nr:hypothetical protein [Beijerinckiaceae bacterium]
MSEITNIPAPGAEQEIPVISPPDPVGEPGDGTAFLFDAEKEAAIDATLARIEASIRERVAMAPSLISLANVLAVLAEVEARADRRLAVIFGAE